MAGYNCFITTTEMLKRGDIISEEDIERDYDIIYSLDMEHWPAPGTNDVVAYNQHFPWDFTELSYHYPLSVVPADRRVFDTEMPGKGEYAFINKFVAPSGPTTENPGEVFECMAGAENGYMLCVNAAGKRATIMNFDFNQLTCSNQQIYLVGNYCNPVDNSYLPEITADMEGSMDGNTWTRIYRYKSGQIPYHPSTESHWYQMALPISRDSIDKYTYFRCRAEINGASQQNAHLLIDRLRFVEKARVTAEVLVLDPDSGKPFNERICEVSGDADLTFVGMRGPGQEENPESYADYVQSLTSGLSSLPLAVFALAGEAVEFRRIFRE